MDNDTEEITYDMMRDLDCLEGDLEKFYSIFPNGMEWTGDNLSLVKDVGLDLGWMFRKMDLTPTDDTREAACQYTDVSYYYARFIDKCPRDDPRKGACKEWGYEYNGSQAAYMYARYVDKCPRNDTRLAACENAYLAYLYALTVDEGPNDITREAACHTSEYAYTYAAWIDKYPRADTRLAACKSPKDAFLYARDVDKCRNELTEMGVRFSVIYEEQYESEIR